MRRWASVPSGSPVSGLLWEGLPQHSHTSGELLLVDFSVSESPAKRFLGRFLPLDAAMGLGSFPKQPTGERRWSTARETTISSACP
jgi:hypothetical protein